MLIRAALALAGGACLTLAFPNWEIAGLGWIGPGLLLAAGVGSSTRRAFWFGYLGGAVFFLSSLSWLLRIPFPAGAIAGWISLSAYCALYPATWVWFCSRLAGRSHSEAAHFGALRILGATPWARRLVWTLACGAAWCALEMIRVRFLSGFPWNLLGASQFRMLPVTQLAAWTGVYGVGFLMVWFSAALLCAAAKITQDASARRTWLADMVLPLLAVSAVTAFGFNRLARGMALATQPRPTLKIALIQPAIPQTVIWDPNEAGPRFRKLLEMSETALAKHPDLLVWPEGVMPPWTLENHRDLTNMLASHHAPMILGADFPERVGDRDEWHNTAFLFGSDGTFLATYHKRRLVIFGEYVPLARWLPFLRRLTPIQGEFTPGKRPGDFPIEAPPARLGVFICFEDVFPDPSRDLVRPDTDALLNLTNDGWFGEGSEQWQHAALACFRAVENGIPLVRCTNNGLTGWFDEMGRPRQILGENTGIYTPGIMIAEVPLLDGRRREPTFYRRRGDVFGWACVAWTAMLLARSVAAGFRRPETIADLAHPVM